MGMVKKVAAPVPYVWSKWPTWATNAEGHKRICHNPEDYERHTGIRVDERGDPVDVEPPADGPGYPEAAVFFAKQDGSGPAILNAIADAVPVETPADKIQVGFSPEPAKEEGW